MRKKKNKLLKNFLLMKTLKYGQINLNFIYTTMKLVLDARFQF